MLPHPGRRAIHPLRWAVPASLLLIAVPCGIEDYSRQINTASTDDQRRRIGKRYGIHVVPPDGYGKR